MSAVYLPLLLSTAALLIAIFSFFFFRSYLKRRTGQERILAELREEVNTIVRSINETVDRDISLVEEREKTLKALLADIERRVKVYIREMDTRREADSAYSALAPREMSAHSPASGYPPAPRGRPARPAATGVPQADAPPAGTSAPAVPPARGDFPQAAAESGAAGAVPAPGEPDLSARDDVRVSGEPPAALPIGEQIRSLMRAGLPVPAVASRLGISITEVEFAAALLERRNA